MQQKRGEAVKFIAKDAELTVPDLSVEPPQPLVSTFRAAQNDPQFNALTTNDDGISTLKVFVSEAQNYNQLPDVLKMLFTNNFRKNEQDAERYADALLPSADVNLIKDLIKKAASYFAPSIVIELTTDINEADVACFDARDPRGGFVKAEEAMRPYRAYEQDVNGGQSYSFIKDGAQNIPYYTIWLNSTQLEQAPIPGYQFNPDRAVEVMVQELCHCMGMGDIMPHDEGFAYGGHNQHKTPLKEQNPLYWALFTPNQYEILSLATPTNPELVEADTVRARNNLRQKMVMGGLGEVDVLVLQSSLGVDKLDIEISNELPEYGIKSR